jgi:hypothetical protein
MKIGMTYVSIIFNSRFLVLNLEMYFKRGMLSKSLRNKLFCYPLRMLDNLGALLQNNLHVLISDRQSILYKLKSLNLQNLFKTFLKQLLNNA